LDPLDVFIIERREDGEYINVRWQRTAKVHPMEKLSKVVARHEPEVAIVLVQFIGCK